MEAVVEFNNAVFKHGCTEADIRSAINTRLYDDMWDGMADKHLLISFGTHGNLLEVMYNRLVPKPGWFLHKPCGFSGKTLRNRDFKRKLFRN
jgi:hypothetical protein